MFNFNAQELKLPINYFRKKICDVFPKGDNLIENCFIILTELIVVTLLINGIFYIIYKRKLNKIKKNVSIDYFLLKSFTSNISTVNSNEISIQPMTTRPENENSNGQYEEITEVGDQIHQNQKANKSDFSDTGYSSRN